MKNLENYNQTQWLQLFEVEELEARLENKWEAAGRIISKDDLDENGYVK